MRFLKENINGFFGRLLNERYLIYWFWDIKYISFKEDLSFTSMRRKHK